MTPPQPPPDQPLLPAEQGSPPFQKDSRPRRKRGPQTGRIVNIAHHAVKGVFPPIGIFFVLALLVVTLGVPLRSANVESMPYYVFLVGAFLLGFLLWRTPRERYSTKFVSLFGWLPVTLGSLSYIFWYWYAAGSEVDTAFFHVAGDVLPVFLLATIVDARRTNELEGKQLVLPIAAVIIGEFSALNSLAFPTGDLASQYAVVSSSLVTAIVALLLAVMADISRPAAER